MSAPAVKGWCPGAHRPMASGDGLIVRIRPRLARLEAKQAKGLCDLATRFGSGVIDLTNRANLQLRGVAETDHRALLSELEALGLLDTDPDMEARRNLLVSPYWAERDLTARLAEAVLAALPDLPDLPAKVGTAIDTGPRRLLASDPADFRFELGPSGLLLRADGAPAGRPVTEDSAISALIEMAKWFDARRTSDARRMTAVVAQTALPADWVTAEPGPTAPRSVPGATEIGQLLGAAFGQIEAEALARLMQSSGARALRVTPWRLMLLEGACDGSVADSTFLTDIDDPLLTADACVGAPACPQATVDTRRLARALAVRVSGSLHVSGCAKGCARARPAEITLTGREGRFDLIRGGTASAAPVETGLSPVDILARSDL